MTSDIHLAFAHPSERAEAMSVGTPLDRISVRDHVVEVDIGAFQIERGTTQRVRFNVVVEVQPLSGAVDDDVDRILSYDLVTEAIGDALGEDRLNLLETVAERVATRILIQPQAARVFVRIEKLDRGPGDLGVEIVRGRDDQTEAAHEAQLHPRVMYLSNAAIASDNLTGWIDQMQARMRPLVCCVGPPDGVAPQSGQMMTQRRIDLLAIEQNAWVLAARDGRCVVVATRTELDWAMKNGQISVWAPSKIVLDVLDGPSVPPNNAVALAAWFAAGSGADEMLVIGADMAPDMATDGPVPMRAVSVTQAQL
ncbi:MAG: dihydroneopterin aldolase [Rhodobacteraceae bacterium]|nr:dihydroneopterin aldolase [Paracoccaceae bacterium]